MCADDDIDNRVAYVSEVEPKVRHWGFEVTVVLWLVWVLFCLISA